MSSNWPLKKISDVAYFRNNKRIPLKSLDRAKRQGEFPYYGASGIVDYIDDYIFDGSYLLISEDGENLRTRKTPIAFQAHGKFWVNNHAHILEEKEEGILDYLEYYFSTLDLTPYITGAVQPKLNKANLDAIEIPIPPIDERRSINRTLNHLRDKIAVNTQTNQTLEQIAQAIFKSWFVDFDPVKAKMETLAVGGSADDAELAAMSVISAKTVDELNSLKASNPEAFNKLAQTAALFPSAMQDSELGEIPEGWDNGTIEDVMQFSSERVDVSGLNLRNYISTENMLENKRGITTASSLPSVSSVPAFNENEILISNIRPYFKKIWLTEFKGGRSPDVLGFSLLDPEETEFAYNLLYQDRFFEYMMTTSKGAKMPRGDKSAIKQFSFPLPQKELRLVFSKHVRAFYPMIKNTNKESEHLHALRDALLPELLSGNLGRS
ncbi:restriction endonuclease subunit S [Vibrio vulnificus]|uniref:restriction endonuclease subunit S n=1 Tax=Vibrio vulnificus TaxID=672 RepID=UPI000CD1C2A1|nr:restriction endonuclease subunit S [Vibrio vulnificus]EGR7965714.1 restriction endonuclease subunit S [Vibrio vulnificus]EHK9183079.1 restriction endonuclease subunit S [Vibrio vulnificus]EHU4931601.1 restriction endonuclease subunit S [Vibrio vulnificus]EHZ2752770.1 restriction endonuclease subunit S [Vibrio vulnificus]EHZ2761151.1 restriction endonuclease subunit S [Vibrio vulnificus]